MLCYELTKFSRSQALARASKTSLRRDANEGEMSVSGFSCASQLPPSVGEWLADDLSSLGCLCEGSGSPDETWSGCFVRFCLQGHRQMSSRSAAGHRQQHHLTAWKSCYLIRGFDYSPSLRGVWQVSLILSALN